MNPSAYIPIHQHAKLIAAIVLCLCGFPLLLHAGSDQPVSERKLKAALILRLINFVDWSPSVVQRHNFSVCVVADEPLATAIGDSVPSLPSPVPIQVSLHPNTKALRGCRLIVFGEYDERQVKSFLAESAAEPVLTVGESEEFLRDGGIVRLRVDHARVRIELNLPAASAAGLKISSRLARLAAQTDEPKEGRHR